MYTLGGVVCAFTLLYFAQPSHADRNLVFTALGDWGSGRTSQRTVAKTLGKWMSANDAKFILTLGDNFYYDGVSSIDDEQFETKWRKVYTASSLKCRWYISLGNHDHHKNNAKHQVAFSKKDKRWYLPTPYYSFEKSVATKKVLFVALDTTPLVRRSDRKQLSWLKSLLSNTKADWIIVYGHHPVFSTGSHGTYSAMVNDVMPLLEKNKVALYIAGHDHSYEHLRVSSKSGRTKIVDFVVNGGGGKTLYKRRNTRNNKYLDKYGVKSYVHMATYGFTGVTLTENDVTVRMVDDQGKTSYKFTKRNPRA